MDSVNLDVLKTASRWLEEGHRALLVTVVKTWGSSPRAPGSMLAIRDDGLAVGSVSGGCIEDDLIDCVSRSGIEDKLPRVQRYGVSAEEAHRFGLPCGGTIELVLEPLSASSEMIPLLDALRAGRIVTRTLDLATGVATLGPAFATDGLRFDGARLQTVLGPRCRLLVIGGGQLSHYLARMALGLDYQVTVCDPREEYADTWNVPEATLVRDMPDDVTIAMQLDERSAVVALTHDPKLDDLALMEALKTPAFYIGALGSRRNNDARRLRLREFDLDDEQISRMSGPAGLYIGSRTPPEIAISILAELTAAKNGVPISPQMQVRFAKGVECERFSAGCVLL
ncbi:XdhC family protein [Paraburkholderia sp. JPY432]|uniref:XdhC family protein n=1 Tax=Paraburkholderia youngii TaxID=2782701 RepID=UPI0015950C6D|nr:XdhC family protein [Paraburkholderia youngii]NVH75784.1 XdhC family protein [Paraburkholderia youngii]